MVKRISVVNKFDIHQYTFTSEVFVGGALEMDL